MLQQRFAEITVGISIFTDAFMIHELIANIAPSVICIDTIMLHDAQTQITQEVRIFILAEMFDPTKTQIAVIILIFVHAGMGNGFKADFSKHQLTGYAGMFHRTCTQVAVTVTVAIDAVMAIRPETAIAQCIPIAIGTVMRKNLKTDGAERKLHTEKIQGYTLMLQHQFTAVAAVILININTNMGGIDRFTFLRCTDRYHCQRQYHG
jgi:hypothetical protein